MDRLLPAAPWPLHGGEVVHADHPDPTAAVHGVVAGDRSEALDAYVQLATSPFAVPASARLPGLDPARSYLVEPVHPPARRAPAGGGVTLPGAMLEVAGLVEPFSPGEAPGRVPGT